MTDPIEARLSAIDAVINRWGSSAVDEAIVTPDVRWLVGLVRRYRRALEGVAALASSSDIEQHAIWDTAREALNEG